MKSKLVEGKYVPRNLMYGILEVVSSGILNEFYRNINEVQSDLDIDRFVPFASRDGINTLSMSDGETHNSIEIQRTVLHDNCFDVLIHTPNITVYVRSRVESIHIDDLNEVSLEEMEERVNLKFEFIEMFTPRGLDEDFYTLEERRRTNYSKSTMFLGDTEIITYHHHLDEDQGLNIQISSDFEKNQKEDKIGTKKVKVDYVAKPFTIH